MQQNALYEWLLKDISCVVSAYIVEVRSVSMKSNFEMYKMDVKDVLRLRK